MPVSAPATVREQIASGKTAPLYLILGEDDEARARLASEFANVVEEDLRPFNVERVYGGEATAVALIEAARTLPMMAPRRIVIVSRAERVLIPKRESQKAERDLEALEAFIESPEPHATVVFEAGGLDKRRRVVTKLIKHATVVDCGGLDDAGDAQRWVRTQLKERGLAMDADAVRLLVARAGADLSRLRADFDRVSLYASGQASIGRSDVEAVVGLAVSQDDWAVARAIEQGAADVALRELALALDAGAAPLMVLGQLGWVARTKLSAPRIPGAVEALYRTDLALKSSGGDARMFLERLVIELCGPGRPGQPLRRG
jgi:DNA polymerase-3 subunit delta